MVFLRYISKELRGGRRDCRRTVQEWLLVGNSKVNSAYVQELSQIRQIGSVELSVVCIGRLKRAQKKCWKTKAIKRKWKTVVVDLVSS